MATKAKSYGRQKSFSDKARDYKQSLNEAYSAGYASGWNDYDKISNRFGSKTAAVYGYSNGLRNHKRVNKYQGKAGK